MRWAMGVQGWAYNDPGGQGVPGDEGLGPGGQGVSLEGPRGSSVDLVHRQVKLTPSCN